jgi:tyrosyl-tRNA synthetase
VQKWFEDNKVMMLLSAVVFVGGYFFLRLAYHMSDKMPFTQEIILVVLGTLATILITAMLLNKQTTVELEKEQSVKFIELKTETYQNLIDTIEEMVLHKDITPEDLVKLRFHTHRLAIVASPAVLEEYEHFLDVFNDLIAEDKHVSVKDETMLAEALARLTVYIRADLVGELVAESGRSAKQIRDQIMANAT